MTRGSVIVEIRNALRRRSGKAWSVTGGRGTGRGIITITAPPQRKVQGYLRPDDSAELASLLGLGGKADPWGVSFVYEEWEEALDRANGRTPKSAPPRRMEMGEAASRYLAGETENPEVLDVLNEGSDEPGRLYYLLYSSIRYHRELNRTPDLLKRVIKAGAWKRWLWIGHVFSATSLTEYLTAHPPKGNGVDLSSVEGLISSDPEALALLRRETRGLS